MLFLSTLFGLINNYTNISISTEILEVYFSVFGTIYAIVIGFILYVVISNYDEINKQLNLEINSLQDLRDYLLYIDYDKESVYIIREKIKLYIESVINKEWVELKKGKVIDNDTNKELSAIIKAINRIKLDGQDANDKIAVGMLIKTFGDVTTYRTNRINSVSEKLPKVLIHLLFFLSFGIVLPFSFLPLIGWLWLISNFFSAFALVYLLNVIRDLNNHFNGYWCISDKPFRLFFEKIKKSLKNDNHELRKRNNSRTIQALCKND